eukprot:gene5548-3959_t
MLAMVLQRGVALVDVPHDDLQRFAERVLAEEDARHSHTQTTPTAPLAASAAADEGRRRWTQNRPMLQLQHSETHFFASDRLTRLTRPFDSTLFDPPIALSTQMSDCDMMSMNSPANSSSSSED